MDENKAKQIEHNIYQFLNEASIANLEEIIIFAKDKYFNGESVISDDVYDMLIEQLTLLDPDNKILNEVAHAVIGIKVKLPYHMGSMTKIKPSDEKIFNSWKKKYKGSYLISNKLDGVSAMLIINKNNVINMYSKGKDGIGADLSHLIKYINIKNLKNINKYILDKKLDELVLRGELIIKKKIFYDKYNNFSNPRNFVSGQVNSKTLEINYLNDIELIFYEVIYPWTVIDSQYNLLTTLNLSVSDFLLLSSQELTLSNLSNILKNQLLISEYEMDGLIINDINEHTRNSSGNPNYSFAFKETLLVITAIVESVEWNESKHGYLKPVIIIQPIKINGVEIKRATGFNAKYIMDNNIGPGTILKIMRSGDVIPHVVKIDIPTYAQMPSEEDFGKWEFNKSGVDIVVINEMTNERLVKILVGFTKQLNIKGIDEATFRILIENNIIKKLADIFELENKTDKIIDLEGFGKKKVENMIKGLINGFEKMTLLDFMVGSNIFGIGIGEKKIKKILTVYPDIIIKSYIKIEILIKMIDDIEGFDEITAEQFASKLIKFNKLLESIPLQYKRKLLAETLAKPVKNISNKLSGQKIVLTGFRDKLLEQNIIKNDGIIVDSVSKNTTLVICADDMNEMTNKLIKAKELGIKIIKKSDFKI